MFVFISDFAALFFAVAFCISWALFSEDLILAIFPVSFPLFDTQCGDKSHRDSFYHLVIENASIFSESRNTLIYGKKELES